MSRYRFFALVQDVNGPDPVIDRNMTFVGMAQDRYIVVEAWDIDSAHYLALRGVVIREAVWISAYREKNDLFVLKHSAQVLRGGRWRHH